MVCCDGERRLGRSWVVRRCDFDQGLRPLLGRHPFLILPDDDGERPSHVACGRRLHGSERQQHRIVHDRLCGHVVQHGRVDLAPGEILGFVSVAGGTGSCFTGCVCTVIYLSLKPLLSHNVWAAMQTKMMWSRLRTEIWGIRSGLYVLVCDKFIAAIAQAPPTIFFVQTRCSSFSPSTRIRVLPLIWCKHLKLYVSVIFHVHILLSPSSSTNPTVLCQHDPLLGSCRPQG